MRKRSLTSAGSLRFRLHGRGRRASLVFASQYWFYGIEPQGRLWVNGKPAPVEQPFGDRTNGCFMFDLTPGEKVVLELEVNGALRHKEQLRSRPSGVTGLFFLQSDPVPLKTVPVTGWRAAREVNVLSPFDGKHPGGFLYLETVFQTPSGPDAADLSGGSRPPRLADVERHVFHARLVAASLVSSTCCGVTAAKTDCASGRSCARKSRCTTGSSAGRSRFGWRGIRKGGGYTGSAYEIYVRLFP